MLYLFLIAEPFFYFQFHSLSHIHTFFRLATKGWGYDFGWESPLNCPQIVLQSPLWKVYEEHRWSCGEKEGIELLSFFLSPLFLLGYLRFAMITHCLEVCGERDSWRMKRVKEEFHSMEFYLVSVHFSAGLLYASSLSLFLSLPLSLSLSLSLSLFLCLFLFTIMATLTHTPGCFGKYAHRSRKTADSSAPHSTPSDGRDEGIWVGYDYMYNLTYCIVCKLHHSL